MRKSIEKGLPDGGDALDGLVEPGEISFPAVQKAIEGISDGERERMRIAAVAYERDTDGLMFRKESPSSIPPVEQGKLIEEAPSPLFRAGDKVVYPGFGVVHLMEVREMKINGVPQVFYVLDLSSAKRKIMVPTDKAEEIGMRLLIPLDQVDEVFEILGGRRMKEHGQSWVKRLHGYQDKLNTGSIFEMAEVLRDLAEAKAARAALSYRESMLWQKAVKLLVTELSLVMRQPVEVVAEKIQASL